MPNFTCTRCGAEFNLAQNVLDRYPRWTPRLCRECRAVERSSQGAVDGKRPQADGDPSTGVFTDGGSVPNPGPGGWGAVYVVADEIIAERHGHEPHTTNNRMELTALIEGIDLVPAGSPTIIYSDSRLAVRTVTEWAAGWERRGWKRKSGPVENLDLVKKAYYGFRRRPELELRWIKAHVGFRWNEYADALANRWRRED
jgi:ribonuclease HI